MEKSKTLEAWKENISIRKIKQIFQSVIGNSTILIYMESGKPKNQG